MDIKPAGHRLSIVIPLYNEEEVIPLLLERIERAASQWGLYEVIFIDDGSSDCTFDLVNSAATEKNSPYKVIRLSRNFGHQAALTAGLHVARGECVVTMDGDLQDPPELIGAMLECWKKGNKIVYAVRASRKEHLIKRLAYATFYRILKHFADIKVQVDSGDFCLMDKEVVYTLNSLPERNRFIRGLRSWVGFKTSSVVYDRDARAAGVSKYSFVKLVRLAADGLTSFSLAPLRLSVYMGFGIALCSFLIGLLLIVLRVTVAFNVSGWTSLILSVFFMGGVQLVILGVLGEYIGRIYTEVQGRPLYMVADRIGFDK